MPMPPGFAWNGAWAVRFVVPSTIDAAQLGRFSAAEFAGAADGARGDDFAYALRFPCHRSVGRERPVSRARSGISTTNLFTIDPSRPGYPVLQPGGVYYYNLRNFQPIDNTISCPASPGRCDAFVESLLPR